VPDLSALEIAGVLGAGVVAGTVNTVVGAGSLLTFPTLLAFGYTPLIANVSNTVGVFPGAVSGTWGYRRELSGQIGLLRRLGALALAGGVAGAALLLALPAGSFKKTVPFLIVLACVLVALQPRLAARVARGDAKRRPRHVHPVLDVGIFLTGVYGGYFGAAQGVIMIALLGIFVDDDLQRLNAVKNVLAALINGVAALFFIAFSHIAWLPAGLLAAGAIVGGQLGAHIGRRLSPDLLRVLIVVVGLGVAAKLFASW
jgi:uncharacterized membrane protein YfcA